MVWVPGQTAVLGSDDHYPEEAPARPTPAGDRTARRIRAAGGP